MSKAVLVDLRRCIGCRGCQVSCKRWNDREATKTVMNTDPKLEWTNPPSLSPQTYTYVRFVKTGSDESLNWTFAKIQCNHCIEPHCVNACPTTALIKRDNGPVTYRKEVCIGCGYCINACPFGVPHFDEENKVIENVDWSRASDGTLSYERELPNGVRFGASAVPKVGAVDFELWLENGTEETLTGLRTQICAMPMKQNRRHTTINCNICSSNKP